MGIEKITGLAYKKYGRNVNFFHLLKGLTYFEDAEKTPGPMMLDKRASWKEVKKFGSSGFKSDTTVTYLCPLRKLFSS
ncbi:hypothetical protein HKBW3S25_01734, partial [Candidatus Hakubella thermalkaliphila]